MHFLHPLFAVLLALFALLCVRLTFIWIKQAPHAVKFGTIDGLRGYLAFFVFVHHAAIWFTYSHTGVWKDPTSHLYTHFGQSSVALFFMITSFLFYDKLLNSKCKKFDWRAFFIGRFFRLTPLYVAVMACMFLIVAVVSKGVLRENPGTLLLSAVRWLLFTVPGAPHLNTVNAANIVSSVTWSLPYEWCFYAVLPIIALTTRQRPSWALLASAAGLAIGWSTGLTIQLAAIFVGGMLAAQLVRLPRFKSFAQTPIASVMVIASLGAVLYFPSVFGALPLLCLTVAFCLIAGGADLFGLLIAATSRRLGELAYGIYLVHGMLLFLMVNFVIGKNDAAAMSGTTYWICVALLVPILLLLTSLTFRYIEQPGIAFGRKLGARWSGAEPSQTKNMTVMPGNG